MILNFFFIVILFVAVIFCAAIYYRFQMNRSINFDDIQKHSINIGTDGKVCNTVDKMCYDVSKDFSPATYNEASARLGYLNKVVQKLMAFVREKYIDNQTSDTYRKEMYQRFIARYNPHNMFENNPVSDVNTSFVESKGKRIGICLRQKQVNIGEFHDMNLLIYVMLHEMTHIMTKEIGHDRIFWQNFKLVLQDATHLVDDDSRPIYRPIDYKLQPINYCSLHVKYNPYFDNTLQHPATLR